MYDPTVIETEYKTLDKTSFTKLTPEECEIALANGDSSVLILPVSNRIKVYYEKLGTDPNWILIYNAKEEELGYFYYPDVKHLFNDKDKYVESE